MKSFRLVVVSLTLLVLMGNLSCRGRLGDNGLPDGSELTAEQEAAIDSVVDQLTASAKAMTSVAGSFGSIDLVADVVVGVCPVITAEVNNGDVSITLDFPDGCSSDYYGESPVSGAVSVAFSVAQRTFDVVFDGFTTDDQTVDGTFALELTIQDLDRTLTGDIDITTTGVGSARGTMTVVFDLDDMSGGLTVTVVEANLTLTDEDGVSTATSAEGLVIEPVDNGNFVPEAGTLSFDVFVAGSTTETVTLTVVFDAQSPVDGTVEVTIGNSPPIEYRIPGVG